MADPASTESPAQRFSDEEGEKEHQKVPWNDPEVQSMFVQIAMRHVSKEKGKKKTFINGAHGHILEELSEAFPRYPFRDVKKDNIRVQFNKLKARYALLSKFRKSGAGIDEFGRPLRTVQEIEAHRAKATGEEAALMKKIYPLVDGKPPDEGDSYPPPNPPQNVCPWYDLMEEGFGENYATGEHAKSLKTLVASLGPSERLLVGAKRKRSDSEKEDEADPSEERKETKKAKRSSGDRLAEAIESLVASRRPTPPAVSVPGAPPIDVTAHLFKLHQNAELSVQLFAQVTRQLSDVNLRDVILNFVRAGDDAGLVSFLEAYLPTVNQ